MSNYGNIQFNVQYQIHWNGFMILVIFHDSLLPLEAFDASFNTFTSWADALICGLFKALDKSLLAITVEVSGL